MSEAAADSLWAYTTWWKRSMARVLSATGSLASASGVAGKVEVAGVEHQPVP